MVPHGNYFTSYIVSGSVDLVLVAAAHVRNNETELTITAGLS